MKTRILGIFAFIFLLALSCKKDPPQTLPVPTDGYLNFYVSLENNGEKVSLNDTISMQAEYDFYLSLFKLYLSKIYAETSDGSEILVKDIILIDPSDIQANNFIAVVPAGDYKKLKIGFGVDAEQNDSDPLSFDNSHPLSSYQSMYWSMLKYRFAKFEGKAKSRISGTDNIFVAYHPGTDPLYQIRNYDLAFKIDAGKSTNLDLVIDINEIVDGPAGTIDFETEPQSHSSTSDIQIAQKFMENLAASADLSISASLP